MIQIRGRATHFSYGLDLNTAIAVAGRKNKASTNYDKDSVRYEPTSQSRSIYKSDKGTDR